MRPQSIVMFERLFLAALAASAFGFVVSYDEVMDALVRDPTLQQAGLGSEFVLGVTLASFAIYLLLWYLIAHKAANVAKWILVVFVALGAVSFLPSITGSWSALQLLSLAVHALQIAAVACLFRADATAWFSGGRSAEPTTLD